MASSASQVPLVIDCFPYNGELVVPYRVRYLYEHVDVIVIVEARQTHSGAPKEGLFFEANRAQFLPYMDKIHYVVIDEFPEPTAEWLETADKHYTFIKPVAIRAWWREMHQREVGEAYIKRTFAGQKYLVLAADADEMPRRDILPFLRRMYDEFTDAPVYMEMDFYYYSFYWRKRTQWYHPFVVNDRCLASGVTMNEARVSMDRKRILPKAGWHMSYFMAKDDLVRKIESYAHQEGNKPEHKTNESLDTCVRQGRDIFNRGEAENCYRYIGDDLPTGWRELQEHLLEVQ